MKIELKEITVGELTAGYKDNEEAGVIGYDGSIVLREDDGNGGDTLRALSAGVVMAAKVVKKRVSRFDSMADRFEHMATNCIPTIQAKITEVGVKQDKTNLELAEQTGYLKAIAESVRRA